MHEQRRGDARFCRRPLQKGLEGLIHSFDPLSFDLNGCLKQRFNFTGICFGCQTLFYEAFSRKRFSAWRLGGAFRPRKVGRRKVGSPKAPSCRKAVCGCPQTAFEHGSAASGGAT
ncbi:hypothetical protein B8V81_0716 [Paenibacillus pasadenensis]|uniref:Uncharacterized protein n=1 Tax=Paenibacillus pasadenensis TaxID=217090 RepID=A0A2N5NBT1_9BACL|nr:hypothetical protein B8V81_0716 [Paenibacillus pasadenensis]